MLKEITVDFVKMVTKEAEVVVDYRFSDIYCSGTALIRKKEE